MRKLRKEGKGNRITRKILPFALAVGVAGLALFPGCRTPNLNQFKNKQHMSDNMEKQKEKKLDYKIVPKKIKQKEEKKEEPKKIKKEEKQEEQKKKIKSEKFEILFPELKGMVPFGQKKPTPPKEEVY